MTRLPPADADMAIVGGRLFTHLADVTNDLAALDSDGWWVVVVTFEGSATCARFHRVAPAPAPRPGAGVVGGMGGPWASSVDRHAFANQLDRWLVKHK